MKNNNIKKITEAINEILESCNFNKEIIIRNEEGEEMFAIEIFFSKNLDLNEVDFNIQIMVTEVRGKENLSIDLEYNVNRVNEEQIIELIEDAIDYNIISNNITNKEIQLEYSKCFNINDLVIYEDYNYPPVAYKIIDLLEIDGERKIIIKDLENDNVQYNVYPDDIILLIDFIKEEISRNGLELLNIKYDISFYVGEEKKKEFFVKFNKEIENISDIKEEDIIFIEEGEEIMDNKCYNFYFDKLECY